MTCTEEGATGTVGLVEKPCGDKGRRMLQQFISTSWRLFAVLSSISTLLGVVALIIYFTVLGISVFPWQKYTNSWKMRLVFEWFPTLGTDPTSINIGLMVPWLLEGPLFNALDVTFTIISQSFLTLLFLAFLLSTDAAAGEVEGAPGLFKKIRISVQRYIRIKTSMALLVASLTGALYWLWKVDLFFVFGFATFILYYIPHVGITIAVLAPLPLVFLDPQKTWADLLLLFAIPFLIHQLATNLVDPKLLASSLGLHPIVVLLSLAFWSTVWGPVGAIVSVPLTAALRLVLLELEHPYTVPIARILEGNLIAAADFKSAAFRSSPAAPVCTAAAGGEASGSPGSGRGAAGGCGRCWQGAAGAGARAPSAEADAPEAGQRGCTAALSGVVVGASAAAGGPAQLIPMLHL